MSVGSTPGPILVIDPDAVLGQVLSKVLARDGLKVVHAVSATEALELAEQCRPQVALLDCCFRDGKGLELAEQLHSRVPRLRMILISPSPLDSESLARASKQGRIFTRVPDLRELRLAVEAALDEGQTSKASGNLEPSISLSRTQSVRLIEELFMSIFLKKFFRIACIVVVLAVVLVGVATAAGFLHFSWPGQAEANTVPPAKPGALKIALVESRPHTLMVPEDVRTALGIRKGNTDLIAVARKPTQTRPLVMPGSTALDPTRLMRIRARFAPSPSSAEVVEIAKVPEDPTHSGKPETVFREVRSGDRVRKGDLLAVFNSVDVGNKKNDLLDAIYQLRLDEEILKNAKAKEAAVPPVFLWTANRNVQGDVNTVNRAISTLRTWGIPEEDIQAVRDEAENVKKREGKRDQSKEAQWARVEIRAPGDGVVIERNVSLHEIVVDNTTNLFQIAKVDRLSVFANIPEEDLPTLQALPTAERRWTVRTVGSPPLKGFIDDISYIIDPNQHTAVVKGHIDSPDEVLRAGQFISATVELPPPPDVVEVPIDAVVDDGQQCVVFVETDAEKHYYTMRRVQLMNRFDKVAFVRSKPFAKEERLTQEDEELGMQPKEPLRLGERILQSGVGELKAALLDRESEQVKTRPDVKQAVNSPAQPAS